MHARPPQRLHFRSICATMEKKQFDKEIPCLNRLRFLLVCLFALMVGVHSTTPPTAAQDDPNLTRVDTDTPLSATSADVMNGWAVRLNIPATWRPFNDDAVGATTDSLPYTIRTYPIPSDHTYLGVAADQDALTAATTVRAALEGDAWRNYTLLSDVLVFDLPNARYAEFLYSVSRGVDGAGRSEGGVTTGAWGFLAMDGQLIMVAAATRTPQADPATLQQFLAAHATGRAVIGTLSLATATAETNPNWVPAATYTDPSGLWTLRHPPEWVLEVRQAYQVGIARFAVSITGAPMGYRLDMEGLRPDGYFDLHAPNAVTVGEKLRQGIVAENYLAGFIEGPLVERDFGDYRYAEITFTGRSDGGWLEDRLYGLLDLGNGNAVVLRAATIGGDPIQNAWLGPLTRTLVASMRWSADAFPPAVPFVFDPDAATNTTIAPTDDWTQVVGDTEFGPTVRLPDDRFGTGTPIQLTINMSPINVLVITFLTFEDPLIERIDFRSARDLLAQAVPLLMQANEPPSVEFSVVTGVSALDFSTGDYADVVLRVTRSDGTGYVLIWGILLIDGEIVSFWHPLMDGLSLTDGELLAQVALQRGIASTFSLD